MITAHTVMNSPAASGDRGDPQPIGKRRRRPALRLSFAFVILLAFAVLGASIEMELPRTRLADSLQTFSNAWTRLIADTSSTFTRLLARAPSRSRPQHLADAVSTGGHNAGASAVSEGESRSVITYGDQLKITFFESFNVTLDDSGTHSDRAVSTVFPRMDLSGEYPVDEGGNVNIPKLGQFVVAGQTITALQTELAGSFKRVIGRPSDAHVAIVERMPVYVLGMVRNPGPFKYLPGMIVLQAVADAGGINSGEADTSKAIENIRETERLREAEDRMDYLLIKEAQLTAQRDNSKNIEVPPSIKSRMSEGKGYDEPKSLMNEIAGAMLTLSLDRKAHQEQLALADRQVNITWAELEGQNMRAGQLKDQLATKVDMLRELEAIAARGSASKYKLMGMNADISGLVAQQYDVRVAAAQAERSLAEAEFAKDKIETDYASGIENELTTTQHDIDDCAQAIASMRAVVQVLHNSLSGIAGELARRPSLRITRRVAGGFTDIAATDTTWLLPGDVVQVNSAPQSEAALK